MQLMPLPILLQVRKAQVAIGDREVYTNAEGERMSRLKEVNSDWIIRRLERWGRRVGFLLYAYTVATTWKHPRCVMELCLLHTQDALPFIGPEKGALLQQLVREKQPRLAVEVGTLCGYSTLLIAQAMSPDAQLISLECDWKWALVAKRFVYQATNGDKKSKPVRSWGLFQPETPMAIDQSKSRLPSCKNLQDGTMLFLSDLGSLLCSWTSA